MRFNGDSRARLFGGLGFSLKKLLFAAGLLCCFFIYKKVVLKNTLWLLEKYALYSKINTLSSIRKYKEVEMRALAEENKELREILELAPKANKKFIIGKVLTSIYASPFWVVVGDSSKVKKGSVVWFDNNLIGFVAAKKKQFVKIRPLTNKNVKFQAVTKSGTKVILKGAKRFLDIVITDSNHLYKNGDIVMYDELISVGKIYEKFVLNFIEFGKLKWVFIGV